MVDDVQERTALIVDDHPHMRRALAQVVASVPGMRSCGEADSAERAVRMVAAMRPHMLIIDITLGDDSTGEDGIALTHRLSRLYPMVRILVCSMHDSREFAERAMHAGALGYVCKSADLEDLTDAIGRVADDRLYVDESIRRPYCNACAGDTGSRGASRIGTLDDGERRLFGLIGADMGSAEIGRRLGLDAEGVAAAREGLASHLRVDTAQQMTCLARGDRARRSAEA